MASAAKLRRHTERRRAGRFLAEGPNLVEAAAARGLVDEVFVTAAAAQRHSSLLAALPADLAVRLITDAAAKALSDTVTPSGLVAVCRTPHTDLAAVLAASPALIAVAVEMSEPGNAGTLIRIAHAMGAAAVVFTGHSVDPYNGKCLRSSAGSIVGLPVITEPDTAGVLAALRAASVQTLATTVDGEMRLDEAEPLLRRATAWLFGPESHGLPAQVADGADHRIRIPMPGDAESLNVAAAAAICLYQSARARL